MDEGIASFRRQDRPEAVCLVVEGEVDLADIAEFHQAAAALIADARSPAVLDLTGVTFFNSSGIGCLATAEKAAESQGVHLVVEASPAVRRVLDIVGLAEIYDVRAAS